MAFIKTPNLDTTNQNPYLLEEEEFKINAIASLTEAREVFNESY
jgi:hypothetical protein